MRWIVLLGTEEEEMATGDTIPISPVALERWGTVPRKRCMNDVFVAKIVVEKEVEIVITTRQQTRQDEDQRRLERVPLRS